MANTKTVSIRISSSEYFQMKEYALLNGKKLARAFTQAVKEYLKKRNAYKG